MRLDWLDAVAHPKTKRVNGLIKIQPSIPHIFSSMIRSIAQNKSLSEMIELQLFYKNQFCKPINHTSQNLDRKETWYRNPIFPSTHHVDDIIFDKISLAFPINSSKYLDKRVIYRKIVQNLCAYSYS